MVVGKGMVGKGVVGKGMVVCRQDPELVIVLYIELCIVLSL